VPHAIAKSFCAAVFATAGFVATAQSQSEVEPIEVPVFGMEPTLYRTGGGPDTEYAKYYASMREDLRKKQWPEEAERIAQSGHYVVRDEDRLYIYLKAMPNVLVLKNMWAVNSANIYSYEGFDPIGQFHLVSAGTIWNRGYWLLISDQSGAIYKTFGSPVYSPDQTRFFAPPSNSVEWRGCISGVAVYRRDPGKLVLETRLTMKCDHSCTHEWSGLTEIRSLCTAPSTQGGGKVEYRLTYRDGEWEGSRGPAGGQLRPFP
jgi:hypothetical protein